MKLSVDSGLYFASKIASGYRSYEYSKRFVESFQNFVVTVSVIDKKTSTTESFIRIDA